MKRTLLAVLLAAGTLVSAQSFAAGSAPAIVHYGDENDLSWMYVPPTAKQFPADTGAPATVLSNIPHYDDTDNLSWMDVSPTAKQFPADTGKPATVLSNIPHYDDENDLSWMYAPSTANDTHAAVASAPAR